MWPVDPIPDEDRLYFRIHKKTFLLNNPERPPASAFTNTPKEGDNISTDWSKYATPEQCRELVSKMVNAKGVPKNPNDYSVYSFGVGDVRNMKSITPEVLHDPIYNEPEIPGQPNNRAHSIIKTSRTGNDPRFRMELVELGHWKIRL